MQYLFIDVIIALLLLVTVLRGYRRGFVLTLCGFLAIFVALIGASLFSNALTQPASQAIQPIIESSIQQVVSDSLSDGPASGAPENGEQGASDGSMPLQEILDLLKQSPVYRGFADAIQTALDEGVVSATANATMVISDYIATQVARIVLFAVSFILILILWFFISHALDLAFRLPVLSTLNRWGGAAFGLLKGCLLLFVACWLIKGGLLPQEVISGTYLLRFFCSASPLSLLP